MVKSKERKCKECGCTEDKACRGGCYWVIITPTRNLCSKCVKKDNDQKRKEREVKKQPAKNDGIKPQYFHARSRKAG
jgi:hypothetical protein